MKKNVRGGLQHYLAQQEYINGSVSVKRIGPTKACMALYSYDTPILVAKQPKDIHDGRSHMMNMKYYSNTTSHMQNAVCQIIRPDWIEQVGEEDIVRLVERYEQERREGTLEASK